MTHPSSTCTVVDVLHLDDGSLQIHWPGRPKASARTLTADERQKFDGLVAAAPSAEDRAQRDRTVNPLPALTSLGHALGALLDGPDRALQSHFEKHARSGTSLHLVVRLRGDAAPHPAAHWRWELVALDGNRTLGCRDGCTVTTQIGERDPQQPVVLKHGRLRILFMAFSPQNVSPVLDYEGEEDAILQALEPLIERGRVVVEVVEDGTLAELERRLKTGEYDVVHLSGHGQIGPQGPYLAMEDETGVLDRVDTSRLCAVFARAQKRPDLITLASCHSAEGRNDMQGMAAEMVSRGIPAVAGWVRPVYDTDATEAARDLYEHLATGHPLAEAVAFARRFAGRASSELT